MSFGNWINSLPIGQKLIYGLCAGVIVYSLFRLFIHYANKQAKAMGVSREDKKYYTESNKLQNLLGLSGER